MKRFVGKGGISLQNIFFLRRCSAATAKAVEDVQGDNRWMSMHHRFVSEAREGEPDVLWIGDSIVQQLANSHIWENSFSQV